ncbi:GNAT family N-acetyltransferase [Niabella sp.]|uniref:GNAT family N-acetyltransferase n=1 Tax=Niabella sp. TaxID=1962976 RepID=UPI002618EAB0|nr:GNAT family N-acetyltransferase [Niabella sp.]
MERFPVLYSRRLVLRQLTIDDIPWLVKYANNKRISDSIINIPYPFDEPDAVFRIAYVSRGFKTQKHFSFAIVLENAQHLIGEIGLHIQPEGNTGELGYWLGEPFWNTGLTTEAIGAILDFGFRKLGLDRIFAVCAQQNQASIKVLEKNKMYRQLIAPGMYEYSITNSIYG